MKKKLVVFGTGQFANFFKFLISEDKSIEIISFVSNKEQRQKNYISEKFFFNNFSKIDFNYVFVAIGDLKKREDVLKKLKKKKIKQFHFQHSTAFVSTKSKIKDSLICYNSFISNNVLIGNDSIVGSCSAIHHNAKIGKNCLIGGGSQIGASVIIQDNVLTGIGSVIASKKIIIGKNSIIGSGTVILNSVPPNSVVVGNPGRVVKKI